LQRPSPFDRIVEAIIKEAMERGEFNQMMERKAPRRKG
jgi:hypothetical protein